MISPSSLIFGLFFFPGHSSGHNGVKGVKTDENRQQIVSLIQDRIESVA